VIVVLVAGALLVLERLALRPAKAVEGRGASGPEATTSPREEPSRHELARPEDAPAPDAAARVAVPEVPATSEPASPPTGSIEGRVRLEETDEPVSDALVRIGLQGEEEERTTRSDAEGRFALRLPSPATLRRVAVDAGATHGAFADWSGRRLHPGGRLELDLRVPAGGTLRGRVVDAVGRPAPGATVRAWCATRWDVERDDAPPEPDRETHTGHDGAFALEHVGRPFVLEASAPGLVGRKRLHGTIASGAELTGLELVLVPRGTIPGRVTDTDGAPLPGVRVSATCDVADPGGEVTEVPDVYRARPAEARALTDAAGAFALEGLAGSPHNVRVEHPGYRPWEGKHAPENGPLTIELVPGLPLAGRVLGADGRGLAGASVRAVAGGNRAATSSGADGSFRLEGLADDEAGRVHVLADDHAVAVVQPVVLPQAPGDELVVRLDPELGLAGVVVDADGAPLADARLAIEGDRVVDHGGAIITPVPTWEWSSRIHETHSDADGRFRFDRLYAGTFALEAHHPDDQELAAKLSVRSGVEDLVVRIDPQLATDVTLLGTVVDAQTGAPVPRFTVTPMIPSGEEGMGMTGRGHDVDDAGGAWRVGGLDPGEIEVWIAAEGYAPWKEPLREYAAGPHRVDARLSPKRLLRLRVVDAVGKPLGGASVRFTDRAGEELWVEHGQGSRSSRLRLDGKGEGLAAGLPATWIQLEVERRFPRRTYAFELDLSLPRDDVVELVVAETADDALVHVLIAVVEAVPGTDASIGLIEPGGLTEETTRLVPTASRIELELQDRRGRQVARATLEAAPDGTWSSSVSAGETTSVGEGRSEVMVELTLPREPLDLTVLVPGRAPLEIPLELAAFDAQPWIVRIAPE